MMLLKVSVTPLVRRIGNLMAGTLVAVGAAGAQAADPVPSNLSTLDLGDALLSDVREALPESSAIDRSFLDPDYDPNLRLSADAQLSVTFIDEGAGYRNSLGYFTWQDTTFDGLTFSDIDLDGSGNVSFNEITGVDGVQADYIFGNFSAQGSGGSLKYGDSTVLGGGSVLDSGDGIEITGGTVFEAGTNVGFFVSANAWNGSEIKGFDGASGEPPNYYSLDFLNPEAGLDANIYESSDESRHTAMLFADVDRDSVLVGFEDLNRLGSSDDDFNDAVFLVQSNPVEALIDNHLDIATAPVPAMATGALPMLGGLLFAGGLVLRRKSRLAN